MGMRVICRVGSAALATQTHHAGVARPCWVCIAAVAEPALRLVALRSRDHLSRPQFYEPPRSGNSWGAAHKSPQNKRDRKHVGDSIHSDRLVNVLVGSLDPLDPAQDYSSDASDGHDKATERSTGSRRYG